jgi:hypothetical protein
MHKIGQFIVLATVSALLAIAVVSRGNGATLHRATFSSTSSLVSQYEHRNTFRGVANSNLPRTLAQGLHLGVAEVKFQSGRLGQARDGYVDYGTIRRDTDVIAASDGPGRDRFALVLRSADAPREYSFDVALPRGARVVNDSSGAIRISSALGRTTIAPAAAVDAAGRSVPSHYQIKHGKLLIQVNAENATFPVMVDPVSANYWWGWQEWYSRSDVRAYASWYGYLGVAKGACYDAGPLRSLCLSVVGAYTSWIANTWNYAKNTGQCLTMKMTWTGQVIGVNAYSCNWG